MRGVVVWMGDDDANEAAFAVDEVDGCLVEQGDHVPKNVAVWGLEEEASLADCELDSLFVSIAERIFVR